MRRLGLVFHFLIFAAILLIPASAAAQYSRFDFPEYTINQSAPIPGGMYPMLAFPGVAVQLCSAWTSSACTSLLQTYLTASGTACPTSAQLVSPQPGSACSAVTDSTGDLGGFALPGNYAYFVTTSQGTYGPYQFGVGTGGSFQPTMNILVVGTGPGQFATVTAALTALGSSGGQIFVTCGTYSDNIDITTSGVRIVGSSMNCVKIQPANTSLPVITFDATNAGANGLVNNEASDLSVICPSSTTCSDGIKITGVTNINQPNDWIKVSRVNVISGTGIAPSATFGFLNGINIAGRTIWTIFENVSEGGSRGNGVTITGTNSPVVNAVDFFKLRASGNWNYGVYIQSTNGTNTPQNINFLSSDIESDGLNTALASCAGLLLNGTEQVLVEDSDFEANCASNSADATFSDLRSTGSIGNQALSIIANTFESSAGEWAVYIDTGEATGTLDGNRFSNITANHNLLVATSNAASQVNIGSNFNLGTPTITPDGNGDTHVHALAPFMLDYSGVSSLNISAGTLTLPLSGQNTAFISGGPFTLSNIVQASGNTAGSPGQFLFLSPLSAALTLTLGAGGTGQIVSVDSLTTLPIKVGESLLLYSDGTNWHPYIENIIGAGLLAANNTWTGTNLFSQLQLTNNSYVSAKNSSSVLGNILGTTSGNNIEIGDVQNEFGAGTLHIYAPGGQIGMQMTSSGVTFPHFAPTFTVGYTNQGNGSNQSIAGNQSVTLAPLSNLGSGATVVCQTGFTCTSMSGTLHVTTGTGPATGDGVKISWSTALSSDAVCIAKESAGSASTIWVDTTNNTSTQLELYAAWASLTGGVNVTYFCTD